MKALVVFYSLSGNTEKIAESIARRLDCDIEKLNERKDRTGKNYMFWAFIDIIFKRKTKLNELEYDPASYDVVIIGTPVWIGHMAPAVRTYLSENREKFKNIAFFSTRKGNENPSSSEKIIHFKDLSKACKKEPLATLDITKEDIDENNIDRKTDKFISRLKR